MKSTILFLALAVMFGIYMVIRSKTTKNTIAEYFRDNALVIDVRSKQEFDQGHFKTAVNIPIDQFEGRISESGTDRRKPIIVYCHAGSRAAMAENILRKNGFLKVINARNYDALKKYEK
jgi:rhodanese-related sulfurtransferase